ncbi:MAG: DNA topoisomerase VI subunit B [Phycisphaerae bacterium]
MAKKSGKKKVKKASKKSSAGSRKKATSGKSSSKRAKKGDSAGEERAPAIKVRKPPKYATAESMAKAQRDISISEFFAKNRHLLGFDNPRKALLTTVKEAVDNALDACEEAGVLPVVQIAIEQLDETHFKVRITDNGPGIVRKQIPSIFGRLLYGSKFHRLRMSRGQQGIGISAAGMYGLLTTGRPVKITSRTSSRSKAHHYELQIDTQKNRPVIIRDEPVDWDVDHGTCVEIELEARYLRGRQSVDDYLEQTAIANPHVTLIYNAPDGREEKYEASVKELPAVPREVRPHPYGVELGVLIKMMQDTRAKSVQQFLTSSFSRVSPRVAKEIIEKSGIRKNARVKSVNGDGAKAVYQAIQETKILSPSTDCVVPIGSEELERGLQHVVPAAFYTATTRRPAVYRGNPFIIEAGLAYGRPEKTESDNGDGQKTTAPGDEKAADEDGTPLAKIIRFANRVPLLYQQSSCAIYKSVLGMNWRSYGIPQSRGALPAGPLTIVVHMASVWVPFTSESKEAIASYPEITKEIRLALQDCGRKLGRHVRRTVRMRQELKKRSYIEKYIPAIGEALRDILDLKEKQVDKTCEQLKGVLERSRKM